MKVSKMKQKKNLQELMVLFNPLLTLDWCLCSLKIAHGCPSRHNQQSACLNACFHKKLHLILDGISFIKGSPVPFPTSRDVLTPFLVLTQALIQLVQSAGSAHPKLFVFFLVRQVFQPDHFAGWGCDHHFQGQWGANQLRQLMKMSFKMGQDLYTQH